MSSLKTECPFHKNSLEIGGYCNDCDYYIQNNSENSFKFNKTEEDRDIYKSYENAYGQLSEDDLKNAIYAEEYQFDLAFETHNTLGRFAVWMLLNWESGVGFYRKVFSQKLQKVYTL